MLLINYAGDNQAALWVRDLQNTLFIFTSYLFSLKTATREKEYLIFLPLPGSSLFPSLSSHLPSARNEGRFLTGQGRKGMVGKEGEESNPSGSLLQPHGLQFNAQPN